MVSGTGTSPTPEQLQDLLLESPGFADFLLGLTTLSAAGLSGQEPMLCAITVERDGTPATVASSSEDARRMDELQYAIDHGPCLTALRHHTTILVPDVATDERWEDYAAAVSAAGIVSVLAVPIATDPGSAAALNCYALSKGLFSTDTVAAVQRHAEAISRILRLALRVHPPEIYPEHLRSALKSRAIVDAAVSLIMIQTGHSRERSLELLHRAARATDTKLHAIAADILQGASLPPADTAQ